jgi:hypothetical protein
VALSTTNLNLNIHEYVEVEGIVLQNMCIALPISVDWLIDLYLTPTLAIFQLNGGFKKDLVIEESGHGL